MMMMLIMFFVIMMRMMVVIVMTMMIAGIIQAQAELDDLIASECVFCGDLMIR